MISYVIVERQFNKYAAMAQSVERRLGKAEVTGSSPVSSFRKINASGKFAGSFFAFVPILCLFIAEGYYFSSFLRASEFMVKTPVRPSNDIVDTSIFDRSSKDT